MGTLFVLVCLCFIMCFRSVNLISVRLNPVITQQCGFALKQTLPSAALRPVHVRPPGLGGPCLSVPGRRLHAPSQSGPAAHPGDGGVSGAAPTTQTSAHEGQQVRGDTGGLNVERLWLIQDQMEKDQMEKGFIFPQHNLSCATELPYNYPSNF